MVGPSGLEPPTSCLSGTRSNLLSYEPMWLVSDFRHLNLILHSAFCILHCELCSLVEMMGFDSRRELRALVADGSNSPPDCYSLPSLFESRFVDNELNLHIRYLVEMMGFEPMTPCLQGRCSPS